MSDKKKLLEHSLRLPALNRTIEQIGDIGFLAAGLALCMTWWRFSLSGSVPPEMMPYVLLGASLLYILLFACKLLLLISKQLSLISKQQYFGNALVNPKTRDLAIKAWEKSDKDPA